MRQKYEYTTLVTQTATNNLVEEIRPYVKDGWHLSQVIGGPVGCKYVFERRKRWWRKK